jgi:hypothetical protein
MSLKANNTTGSSNSENVLKTEGILNNDEEYETVYLAEDEIEKFMEKYLAENPDVEIETRYIKQPPVQLVQDIQVRWLRPPTPEMPPIIIREVSVEEKAPPPLRLVEKPRAKAKEPEPIIIRERPPAPPIGEPKIAFVQNVIKHEAKKTASKEIRVEHVSSQHLNDFTAGEHTSFFETQTPVRRAEEANEANEANEVEEQELLAYEEKLKKTLYNEYLQKLEREKRERVAAERPKSNRSLSTGSSRVEVKQAVVPSFAVEEQQEQVHIVEVAKSLGTNTGTG